MTPGVLPRTLVGVGDLVGFAFLPDSLFQLYNHITASNPGRILVVKKHSSCLYAAMICYWTQYMMRAGKKLSCIRILP